MTDYKLILLERDVARRVAVLTLNRPEVHNALNADIRYEIDAALDRVVADDGIGALVITGAGAKSFSVGADLKSPESNHSVSDFGHYLPGKRQKSQWYDKLICFPKGVVSAVNGYCAGSGLQLAMAADVVVASTNAAFWMPQAGLGLAPHVPTMVRMARFMGQQRVMQMALTGRRMNGETAARVGLACEVVAPEQLLDAARDIAADMAKVPQLSIQVTKESFLQGMELAWEQLTRVDAWKEFCMYQNDARKASHQAFAERSANR
ncbi:MAG TPA: enoyl-CoA hydratase/isomerase family protein [Casimicrobiaceae bacterium]|nr:enoyl-CoA hydratase/isomerase family protein [Casimicrobiaceae bacterium]